MSAITAGGPSSGALEFRAEAARNEIERALTPPRVVFAANLRAGSALLDFAGQRLHAETEFLERLFDCRDLAQASALHAHFVATMIGDCGRELSELTALARDNVALIADAAETARPA